MDNLMNEMDKMDVTDFAELNRKNDLIAAAIGGCVVGCGMVACKYAVKPIVSKIKAHIKKRKDAAEADYIDVVEVEAENVEVKDK